MKDKLNALRLLNLMESELAKLEAAFNSRDSRKISEEKTMLLRWQAELQKEILK